MREEPSKRRHVGAADSTKQRLVFALDNCHSGKDRVQDSLRDALDSNVRDNCCHKNKTRAAMYVQRV